MSGSRAKATKNLFAANTAAAEPGSFYSSDYQRAEDRLIAELSKCTQHNEPNQLCKIDKDNQHRLLNAEQLRTWATAMVRMSFLFKISPVHWFFLEVRSKAPCWRSHCNQATEA